MLFTSLVGGFNIVADQCTLACNLIKVAILILQYSNTKAFPATSSLTTEMLLNQMLSFCFTQICHLHMDIFV